MVALVYTLGCPTCAYRNEGVMVRPIRINKCSMRTTGPGLGFIPRKCQECSSPLGNVVDRIDLSVEDQPKVDAYRVRKGWAPLRWSGTSGERTP